jgi:hypothetical protein
MKRFKSLARRIVKCLKQKGVGGQTIKGAQR